MSPPSGNALPLLHTGGGVVLFRIPEAAAPFVFQPRGESAGAPLPPRRAAFYLFLLRLGQSLTVDSRLRQTGAFYTALLREGFLQNGAVTFIGTLSQEGTGRRRILCQTVIQLDGDIICKIDRSILSKIADEAPITHHLAVCNQVLADFRKAAGSAAAGFSALIAALLSLAYLLFRLF